MHAGPGRGGGLKNGRAMGSRDPRARAGIVLVQMRRAAGGNESRSGLGSRLRSSREPLRRGRAAARLRAAPDREALPANRSARMGAAGERGRVQKRITPHAPAPVQGGRMLRNPGRGTVVPRGRRLPERRAHRAAGTRKALPARR